MSESLEPLPCPWCGGPAKIYDPSGEGTWWAIKTECLPQCKAMRGGYPTEAETIAAWNRRVPATPPPDAELDALLEVLDLYRAGKAEALEKQPVHTICGQAAAAIRSLRSAREMGVEMVKTLEEALRYARNRLGPDAAIDAVLAAMTGEKWK